MFNEILLMVVSIFAGALGKHLGIFRDEDGALLSKIVLTIFLPSMIILSMMKVEIEKFYEIVSIFVATAIVLFTTLGITAIASNLLFRRRDTIPILILNGTFGNSGFMGIPIVFAVYGYDGVQRILFSNLGFAVIFWTLGVYICALYGAGKFSFNSALGELLKNPPTLSTFLGLLIGFGGLQPPLPLIELMDVFQRATIPLSMIAIGIFLRTSNFRRYLAPSFFNGFFKFLISPALALLIADLLKLSQINAEILFLASIMPPAVLNTILASKYSLNTELSSAITIINTLISLPLIFVILLI